MRRPGGLAVAGVVAAVLAAGATITNPAAAAPISTSVAACSVHGPLMGLAPYPGTRVDGEPAFVNLTATDGRGTYAGVSFTDTDVGFSYTVVRRAPTGAVTVLGRFLYFNTVVNHPQAVRVVGIDPWGGVVARVQRTNPGHEAENVGIRYDAAGVRHDLTTAAGWLSVDPVAVADSGSVVGTVTGTDLEKRVVIWRGPGSGVMTRLSLPGRYATGFAPNADWYDDGQHAGVAAVHPHGNAPTRLLATASGDVGPTVTVGGTSSDSGLGIDYSGTAAHLVRWTPGAGPSTAAVVPTTLTPMQGVTAVGRYGDVVGELAQQNIYHHGVRVLRTRTGKVYPIPAEYQSSSQPAMPEVVDTIGKVVYTGSARLPLVLECAQ